MWGKFHEPGQTSFLSVFFLVLIITVSKIASRALAACPDEWTPALSCPGVPIVVRTVQDPSAATHGANDHGWGLPGVPSQVIIEVGTSQVLVTAVGDLEDKAEDRKGRAYIPGGSHRTKYFSWWSSGAEQKHHIPNHMLALVKVRVTWFRVPLKHTPRQGSGGKWYLWEVTPGSTVRVGRSETEKEGKPKRPCQ